MARSVQALDWCSVTRAHPALALKRQYPGEPRLGRGTDILGVFCQDSKIAYVEQTKTFMRSCPLLSSYLLAKGGVIQDGKMQLSVRMVQVDNFRLKSSQIPLTMI